MNICFYFQYVSSADERLRWEVNQLPSDDLCRENAVMLKRFTRYPLIIDPSGQALEFLHREYREKNIVQTRLEEKTNFLENASEIFFSLLVSWTETFVNN